MILHWSRQLGKSKPCIDRRISMKMYITLRSNVPVKEGEGPVHMPRHGLYIIDICFLAPSSAENSVIQILPADLYLNARFTESLRSYIGSKHTHTTFLLRHGTTAYYLSIFKCLHGCNNARNIGLESFAFFHTRIISKPPSPGPHSALTVQCTRRYQHTSSIRLKNHNEMT